MAFRIVMLKRLKRPAKKWKALLWLLSPLAAAPLYNNCADQQDIRLIDPEYSLSAGVFETRITGKARPLDITWVIDNSGSMNEEAAHVRNNFNQFVSSVSAGADSRIALISNPGTTGTSVTLASGPNTRQINQVVGSNNPVSITATTLCPSSGGQGPCGISSVLAPGVPRQVLADYLRAGSQKVFVFVTDDESSMSASQFLDAFHEVYPHDAPVVYGFVGLGGGVSPCMYREGRVYVDLAQATGGSVFNICDSDWSTTFQTLARQVIDLASSSTQLPPAVANADRVRVYVDGVEVSPSLYQIDSTGIHFDASVLAGKTEYTLRIAYESDPVIR